MSESSNVPSKTSQDLQESTTSSRDEVFDTANPSLNSERPDQFTSNGNHNIPGLDDFEVVPRRMSALQETRYNRREFTRREVLKAKLKYHYMNPWQKYKAKGRKPWKLVIQILKIIIVTVQVGLEKYCCTLCNFD